MLQQEKPEDFVIATGRTHTIREFAEKAAKHVGFDLIWQGDGLNEKGIDRITGKTIIEIDPKYFRPTEVDLLIGDPSLAKEKLGWSAKVSLDEMIKLMMDYDKKEAGL
jgi:GDPmannose 4,6-dehydratase